MTDRYLVFKFNPSLGKCPLCGENLKLHRSRTRTLLEVFIIIFSFHRPYRCSGCRWRGFLFTFIYSRKSLFNLCLYTGIAAAASILVMQVLMRMS